MSIIEFWFQYMHDAHVIAIYPVLINWNQFTALYPMSHTYKTFGLTNGEYLSST